MPIFLPGKSHGQRSLTDGPQGHKRIGHDLATKQQQQQKHLLLSWFSVLAALKKEI